MIGKLPVLRAPRRECLARGNYLDREHATPRSGMTLAYESFPASVVADPRRTPFVDSAISKADRIRCPFPFPGPCHEQNREA